MSQEHETPNPDNPVSDGIHPEAAPFEPGYQPGTLQQIHVPDLAEDAQGLSAEALANVPTLTEQVESEATSADVSEPREDVHEAESEPCEPELPAQAQPAQADTWGEHLQVRMGKLNEDIQTLNVRLDRLEERNKKKV